MRRPGLGLVAGLILVAATGVRAGADDDPVVQGVKLSELIKKFNASTSNDVRSDVVQLVATSDSKPAIAFLRSVLKDEKSRVVKINTLMGLNQLGPKAQPLVPDLTEVLKDKDASIGSWAAVTLGVIGPGAKAAAPPLLAFVKDPARPAELRAASAAALGRIGADAAGVVPALKDALKDKNVRVRMACAGSLYAFDKANAKLSVPVLRAAITDEEGQMEAVLRLKEFGSDAKDAVPDLIGLLTKNPVKGEGGVGGYYAPEVLGAIPEAEPALLAALKDPDAKVQKAAATVLLKHFPQAAKKAGLGK